MKSVHVISSLHAKGGGPSYTVPRLAEALTRHRWEVEIAALEAPDVRTLGGVKVHAFKQDAMPLAALARLGRSRAMAAGLSELGGDVFHMHGLWTMPNVYPAWVARRQRLPLILAPRGMLGEGALQFSRRIKSAFWAIWQARAVAEVHCFHATAESELEDIRAFGLKAPVAIVPNGVDLPPRPEPDPLESRAPFVLSLGRLHPKKGLEVLIAAFARVADEHPDWRLRIVGMDEGDHGDTLRRAIAAAGLEGRASVESPVFGDEKMALMARASLFALPSLHENFAVTVAESLAVETPVIASKGAPWSGLETNHCGWWVDGGADALAAALGEAMAMPASERAAMGARGRVWMDCDFGWDGIGARMAEVYDWLLGRSPQPSFVIY
jgi:glycosyltransferase involved in cell wall biosynthesis